MVVPDVSKGQSAYIFRVKQSGLLDSGRNVLLVRPQWHSIPRLYISQLYRCKNLTGGTNQDPCGVYASRHNTLFVYLYIHFCFFRQITLKEGVTKQTESNEDEWPRGRLRGLPSNPMTQERSKVHHNVKERNTDAEWEGRNKLKGRRRITGRRKRLRERKLLSKK